MDLAALALAALALVVAGVALKRSSAAPAAPQHEEPEPKHEAKPKLGAPINHLPSPESAANVAVPTHSADNLGRPSGFAPDSRRRR